MKKVSFIIGSPRKKGNTANMADFIAKNLDKSKYESETVFLYDYEILPCTDCRACKKGDMKCILEDGMKELYPKLDMTDIVIIGTPIYWFGPSAKTKLMLDRFRPYYVNKKLAGKKALLLLPAGVGESDCDLTVEMFKRSFEALQMEFQGAVPGEAYDAGDIFKDDKALKALNLVVEQLNIL